MATEYIWQNGRFVQLTRTDPGEILVADSWRSESGRAAAFDYHVARFEDAVGRLADTAIDWNAIWRGATEIILREPERSLFPRISFEPEGIVLAIRPCMKAREFTSLTVLDAPDPRQQPRIKGPDIQRLAAVKVGAATDDVILSDTDGALLEATTGALVFWRDRGIVISNRFEKQLASVTLRQLYDRAHELEIPVAFRPVYASELAEGALWFVNAVHGVSPVFEVTDHDRVIGIPEHPNEGEWRDWWWTTFAPMGAPNTERVHPSLERFAGN